ncbi:putative E3 ubiquitin-protein ligase RING1a isoform X4 [Pyrus x bretschneideri]|uniref:putative E3 ubiquitin-protein ligase RING1a isoform X4 n=1 Tax=Pyrus x bretschneideri TaxID=225117 RepID=UPI002030D0EA|nr:putative E3 ubiquitin-protein ligase RING1a isoform X4 [Pyrus x bretschneideri]
MPSQKRSSPEQHSDDEDHRHHQRPKQSRPQDEHQLLQQEEEEEEEEVAVEEKDEDDEHGADSDGSASSTSQETPEFIFIQLPELRKDVHCPICLGIIKKTRTVMGCLHRFCRECIDKSMRMGNNECPACRTHCASRRSLRDDPKYDALIAALYPDIEKYEEEELAFHQEERTRNEQIQASIAKVVEQQSEALIKRRTSGKDTPDSFPVRPLRNSRSSVLRRRNSRATDIQGYKDNEDDNDNDNNNMGKNLSSTDDRHEVRPRRRRRRAGFRSSQPTSSLANSSGGCTENDIEGKRENHGISPGVVWSSEMLVWGRGGARSHTRHGIGSGCNSKNSRSTRISKLVGYLRSLEENNNELDVHLLLIPKDTSRTPKLQQPHLCCRSSLSVKHLCEYVSHKTSLRAEEVELLEAPQSFNHISDDEELDLDSVIDPVKNDLKILQEEETLAEVRAKSISCRDYLVSRHKTGSCPKFIVHIVQRTKCISWLTFSLI